MTEKKKVMLMKSGILFAMHNGISASATNRGTGTCEDRRGKEAYDLGSKNVVERQQRESV